MPGGTGGETDRRQHGGQRGRRVVRKVPVPERVPLLVTDDRAQRVILQQQHSARRDPGCALGEGPVLVRGMHQAEAVEDDVSLPAGAGWHEPAGGEQLQPGPAVRTAVLGDHALDPAGIPPRRLVPRRRRPERRARQARCPSAPRARWDRPATGPGRTMNTATSAADIPGPGPGRRTAGNSHRPAAHQDPARGHRLIHSTPGTYACPFSTFSSISSSFSCNY